MNIFYIDDDIGSIAKQMVDKHVVKMPTESAQMLSTAHRVLDGQSVHVQSGTKTKKIFLLPGEKISSSGQIENPICYATAHKHHPSTVWTCNSKDNYVWHFELFKQMLLEYRLRYGRDHACSKLIPFLSNAPKNIAQSAWTPPPLAMPDKYKSDDHLESYRLFYAAEKWKFAKWKHSILPKWFPAYLRAGWTDHHSALITEISKKKSIPMDDRIFCLAKKYAGIA